MKTKYIANLLRRFFAQLFKKRPEGLEEFEALEFRKPEKRERARMLRGEWL